MASSSPLLDTRSLNESSGAAAYCTACASSTLKFRSGIRFLTDYFCPFLQGGKEFSHFAPDFRATGKTMPMEPDKADEFVALVDWNDVVLRSDASRGAHPIYEKRFDFGFYFTSGRIMPFDVFPGL